jgi:hypothetical protein
LAPIVRQNFVWVPGSVSHHLCHPLWHHSDADGATQTHRKEAIEAKKGTKQEQRAPNTAIQLPTIKGQQILDQSSRAKIKASLAELVTLAAIKPKSSQHEPNNSGQ